MPYADLDLEAGRRNGTVWVKLPNKYFDPEKGHKLYNRYLDELEYGEALGFDVLAVNEHHQTAYGLMPSPIVTASALARVPRSHFTTWFDSTQVPRFEPAKNKFTPGGSESVNVTLLASVGPWFLTTIV